MTPAALTYQGQQGNLATITSQAEQGFTLHELRDASRPVEGSGRVAPGECSPEAPTDPDVQIPGIWTAAEKMRIVLAGMEPKVEVSDLCRREGLNPVQYYD